MYLTKIDLIPQQRGIRQALGDCQQLHQMVNCPTVGSLWDDRQDTINGGKNYAAERDLL